MSNQKKTEFTKKMLDLPPLEHGALAGPVGKAVCLECGQGYEPDPDMDDGYCSPECAAYQDPTCLQCFCSYKPGPLGDDGFCSDWCRDRYDEQLEGKEDE